MTEIKDDQTQTDNDSKNSDLSWEEIGLTKESLSAVRRMNYNTPTEVQQKAIPEVHTGKDLIVQAKTGSGKTLAFGLPILEKLDKNLNIVQALVLTPTRELAYQVADEITRSGELGNKTVVPIFGGASMNAQISRIKDGAQIVVGTPGRILDHLNRGTLSLKKAWMVVLDEADEMLDKGFLPDVMKILDYTPREKQTMLFSATIPGQINELAKSYLQDPQTITIGKAGLSINYDIDHTYYTVSRLHKFVSLVNILHSIPRTKVLIFCNQKSDTESVAVYLHEEGLAVGFLMGDLSQAIRTKTLDMFKKGVIDILVATDVAARGIDIFGVSHVINYDVPENNELYVHRTGRTGRAGRTGHAISLVGPQELLRVGNLERKMEVQFIKKEVPTKEDVLGNVKTLFTNRLKAFETEGYEDAMSLLADDIVEQMEPYSAVAGLLTILRQQGWHLEAGYDPDNPEHKNNRVKRRPLLGLKRDKPNPRQSSRPDRGRPKRQPSNGNRRTNTKKQDQEAFIIKDCKTAGIKSPGNLIALVCRVTNINKNAIGKIYFKEDSCKFMIDKNQSGKIVDGFKKDDKTKDINIEKG